MTYGIAVTEAGHSATYAAVTFPVTAGVIARATARSIATGRQIWVCMADNGRLHYLTAPRRGTRYCGRAIGAEWVAE